MKVAYHKATSMSPRRRIECAVCGETDYDKILIDEIGISAGMSGNEYTFCKKCWKSKRLGELIFALLGFDRSMKLKEELVEMCDE